MIQSAFLRLMLLGWSLHSLFPVIEQFGGIAADFLFMSQAAVRRFGRARRILRIITVADKGNQLVTVIIIFVRSVSAVIDIAVLKNGDFTTFGVSPPVSPAVKRDLVGLLDEILDTPRS